MKTNYLAITLKLLSVLSFAIMDVLIKKVSDTVPTFEIIFFRCLFGLIPVFIMIYYTKAPLYTSKANLHFLRAVVAALAMFGFFKSFQLLPLADVSAIAFSSIMITTIMAIFLLNESVGLRRWIAIMVGFIGVFIIFRPGSELFNIYMLLPLLAAIGLSLAVIIVKILLRTDKPPTCSFYMHVMVATIMLLTIPFGWILPNTDDLILLILIGLVGGTAQILVTNAFRLSSVSLLVPFEYTHILWAIFFGIIFFSDYPTIYVIIGSGIIISSSYYIVYREHKIGKDIVSKVPLKRF